DLSWADILERVRYGRGCPDDTAKLNARSLSDKKLRDQVQAQDLPLLTFRNAVKANVATKYLKNWTLLQKQPLVVTVAVDSRISREPVTTKSGKSRKRTVLNPLTFNQRHELLHATGGGADKFSALL